MFSDCWILSSRCPVTNLSSANHHPSLISHVCTFAPDLVHDSVQSAAAVLIHLCSSTCADGAMVGLSPTSLCNGVHVAAVKTGGTKGSHGDEVKGQVSVGHCVTWLFKFDLIFFSSWISLVIHFYIFLTLLLMCKQLHFLCWENEQQTLKTGAESQFSNELVKAPTSHSGYFSKVLIVLWRPAISISFVIPLQRKKKILTFDGQ